MTKLPSSSFDQTGETCTPVDLSAHYKYVRQHTVALSSPLSAEDYVPQPTPDVSPPKWHLGHTSWHRSGIEQTTSTPRIYSSPSPKPFLIWYKQSKHPQ